MNPDKLGSFEKDQLLRWFLNYMPMEQRYKLMREYPAIYNKGCDSEIVTVNRVSDGMPV